MRLKTCTFRGTDGGGGWSTGCGSHPQSAERVEEVEQSVRIGVPYTNKRDIKGKVHKTVVRPALTSWTLKKAHEKKLMLDKIINDRIRGTREVREIAKKVNKVC